MVKKLFLCWPLFFSLIVSGQIKKLPVLNENKRFNTIYMDSLISIGQEHLRGVLLLPPSFVNDVEPILTRFGCNQGACHGKGAGQNGFRLSLRGYDPEGDFLTLTRQARGRRIVPHDPDPMVISARRLALTVAVEGWAADCCLPRTT